MIRYLGEGSKGKTKSPKTPGVNSSRSNGTPTGYLGQRMGVVEGFFTTEKSQASALYFTGSSHQILGFSFPITAIYLMVLRHLSSLITSPALLRGLQKVHQHNSQIILKTARHVTRNSAKDVMNPSFVSSHVPPYSSSSICWKLLK